LPPFSGSKRSTALRIAVSGFLGSIGSSFGGFFGEVAAGCVSARMAGGRCSEGARAAAASSLGGSAGSWAAKRAYIYLSSPTPAPIAHPAFSNPGDGGTSQDVRKQVLTTSKLTFTTATGVTYVVLPGVDVRVVDAILANDGMIGGLDSRRIVIEGGQTVNPKAVMEAPHAGTIVVNNANLAPLLFGDVRSILYHEQIHIVQWRTPNARGWFSRNVNVMEFQAYQAQAANYHVFGDQRIPRSHYIAQANRFRAGW
jgi:hypothetical protein